MDLMRDRNFLCLISANILSRIGSGITMIGVPWYLVTQSDGSKLLGIISLTGTILLFFVSPYIGVWVDRYSRKRLHRIIDFAGFMISGSFALWGLISGHFVTLQLIALYLAGEVYFSFHFPTVFALTQEIFPKKLYGKVNSAMEIQGQAASMISGGLAGVLISRWGLADILLADAATYLASFILFGLLRYRRGIPKREGTVTFFSDFQEGWTYLKQKPSLIVFFLVTFVPFLVVLVTNYLFPVYVAKTLHASASVFAVYEVIFAAGAVFAGMFVNLVNRKLGIMNVILLNAALFTAAIFSIGLLPFVAVFLVMQVFLGWGNAGMRINRKTLMMEQVPNHLIGRVNSFYSVVGIALRLLLIGSFTATVSRTGASFSVIVLGVMLILALFGIMVTRKTLGTNTSVVPNSVGEKL